MLIMQKARSRNGAGSNLSYPLAFAHAHAALEDWAGELLLLLVMFFERLRKENLRYRTDLEE
jgi:hypothetical protein